MQHRDAMGGDATGKYGALHTAVTYVHARQPSVAAQSSQHSSAVDTGSHGPSCAVGRSQLPSGSRAVGVNHEALDVCEQAASIKIHVLCGRSCVNVNTTHV